MDDLLVYLFGYGNHNIGPLNDCGSLENFDVKFINLY
jgi:hypothetical protein